MKNHDVHIIKLLLEHKDKELSIQHIAQLLKKDYKTVHTIIQRLSLAQFVQLQPFGHSYRVHLIPTLHPLLFEAEYLRRRDFLKNKNFAVMYDSFQKLSSFFYVFLVFGSYAKKTSTKHSDIDLLFIVPDIAEEKMEKEIYRIAHLLPLPLHINIFKETDFKAMHKSKEITVGSEAIRNNILLQGIEAYYRMLQ